MNRLAFAFEVPASHPALPGHFPGRPIVPGVWLLDEVAAGLRRATGRDALRLRQVKFVDAMRPGEAADVSVELDGARASFVVAARRDGAPAVLARGVAVLAEPRA